MIKDLRFAWRMITHHRWFSLAVIVTLALGIGINTTVFTIVNAVLFKPVPIPGGERLVTLAHYQLAKPENKNRVSWPDYLEYRNQNRSFEGLEAASRSQGIISEPGNPPERYQMSWVTPGLYTLLSTPPVLGRGLAAADGQPGAEGVVLLGYGIWQNRYAGASNVIGRSIRVNGSPATIIGVMPEGFRFPSDQDFWMALSPDAEREKRTNRSLDLFALLKPGTSLAEANSDVAVIAGRLATQFPDTNKDYGATVRTFHETYNGDRIRTVFLMMLGAVGFVLLIACANVANMMLSRAIARGREISVRAALGAARWQIVRQLLIESVLLSVLGGALGLGFAVWGVRAFDLATHDVGKPYWIQFTMDWRAFVYFAAVSVVSGLVFGLVPALRASRVDLNSAMKEGSPGGGSHRGRLTAALVVLQFALTVILLTGAGMMVRSFFAAQALNPFVHPETILTARVQLAEDKGKRYAEPTARLQFFEQLLPELRALPGAREVTAASNPPGMSASYRDIEIEGQTNPNPKQPFRGAMVVHTPGYLSMIGLPLLQGRSFDELDGDKGKEAAVVTRSFATRYWPGDSAMGKRFRFAANQAPGSTPGPWMSVVGIASDMDQNPGDKDAPPLFFAPHRQQPWGWIAVLIRTSADPTTLASALRATVQKIDPDLPLYDVRSLSAALDRQTWFLNVFGTLFAVFALIGLLIASVGIYAVVAHTTARRTREIGVRMALGATTGAIARMVLSRGLLQLGIGLLLGLGGALASTRLLDRTGFLIGTSPNDPLVFVAISLLLLAIGSFACWLPARRAARIAPTVALRTE